MNDSYQLPRDFTSCYVDRSGGKTSLHLRPGAVCRELDAEDLRAIGKQYPSIRRKMRKLEIKRPARPAPKPAPEAKAPKPERQELARIKPKKVPKSEAL